MAQSTVIRNIRDGIVTLSDLGAVHSEAVTHEKGDLAITIPGVGESMYLDRGVIGAAPSIRQTDDAPMTLSWSMYFRDAGDTAHAYQTMWGIIHRPAGSYELANWASTLGASSDAYRLTIAFTIIGTTFGESNKTMTFPFCKIRANMKEGDPNTIECSAESAALIYTLS